MPSTVVLKAACCLHIAGREAPSCRVRVDRRGHPSLSTTQPPWAPARLTSPRGCARFLSSLSFHAASDSGRSYPFSASWPTSPGSCTRSFSLESCLQCSVSVLSVFPRFSVFLTCQYTVGLVSRAVEVETVWLVLAYEMSVGIMCSSPGPDRLPGAVSFPQIVFSSGMETSNSPGGSCSFNLLRVMCYHSLA